MNFVVGILEETVNRDASDQQNDRADEPVSFAEAKCTKGHSDQSEQYVTQVWTDKIKWAAEEREPNHRRDESDQDSR
jgi:hypothetical protein